jgi:hypothetical protein
MLAMPDDGLLESVNQSRSVRIIADDLLAGIPPRHHLIDGAFELDPQSSWRFEKARGPEIGCQPKTKNKG